MNLLKYNRHWEKGFRYPFPKKRELFSKLLKTISERWIVEITGLRRVGKTTLLFQLINQLLDKGINPFRILYFSFDEEKAKIDELLDEFYKETQIEYQKEKVFIFLDEIQKLPEFQNQLKVYYDLYPNIKFFISGSCSLFVKKKTQESLAGRCVSFMLNPLSFKEYLYFKEKKDIVKNPSLYKSELEREFEIYLESQFIESVWIKERQTKKEYFNSIIKKIIYEDIPQIFPVENPEILFQIVKIVAQRPGILIDYKGLSKELGISNKTLSSYLFYLEESFLVKKLFNFSKNLITSERKLKKFYLSSPSFSLALVDFTNKGEVVENFIISLKSYRFFWRDPYKHEVDFVDTTDSEIIPIEVKYKDSVSKEELKTILLFSKRFKTKRVIVFNKSWKQEKEKIGNVSILKMPIYFVE